jgi:acetyltransferase/esterase
LIEHLSDEPGIVFGSSSGGVVALTVLSEHPSVVRVLVPLSRRPSSNCLTDRQGWTSSRRSTISIDDPASSLRSRPSANEFSRNPIARSWRATDPSNGEQVSANAAYWFEHELRQYPAAKLDVDALKAHADRILPVVGRASHGYPTYEVNVELGNV